MGFIAFQSRNTCVPRESQNQSFQHVLCHADMHGWNLLIDQDDHLYLIDWDTLTLAPKERDLMFIGAGIWNSGYKNY